MFLTKMLPRSCNWFLPLSLHTQASTFDFLLWFSFSTTTVLTVSFLFSSPQLRWVCWPRFGSDLHTYRWPASLLPVGPLSERGRAGGAAHQSGSFSILRRDLGQRCLVLPLPLPAGTAGAGASTHRIHLLPAGGGAALWISVGRAGTAPPSHAMWPL